MPSRMPPGSSNSAGVTYLDGDKAISDLRVLASKLLASNLAVQRVLLFGSLARGDYTPRSDADIMVVLAEDDRRVIDRMPDFLRAFLDAPVAVEVYPYTEAEIDRMLEDDNFFIRRAMKEAIVLASR